MRLRRFSSRSVAALLLLMFWPVTHASAGGLRTSYETVASDRGPAIRLHVVEAGSGPPVLLLHGIGGSAYAFRHFIPVLARSHRVIAVDLKGFGRSDKPLDHRYATADHAALVAALIRQLRLSGVTIVGHSYGGSVALHLAINLGRTEPHRIRRLVLMGVPAYPQALAPLQRLLTTPVVPYVALMALPPILATRQALDTWPRRAPPASDRDAMIYAEPLYEAGGRHALIATTRLIAEGTDNAAIRHYPAVRQPTLLLWCRDDPTVPLATGERLARTLPRSRLAVIEGCEHTPNEEAPGEALRLITAFLKS